MPAELLEHADLVPQYLHGTGTEIGAFKTPIPGIRPIYVDRFTEYAGEPTRAEFFGDACDLPMHDASLDYVASSHLIEHSADPLGAIKEWCRVLKHRGIIYMVVPHRRYTFDHSRALTTVEHMVEDFHRKTSQVDDTHIHDFVHGIDWALFSPGTPEGEVEKARMRLEGEYRSAIAAGREINIHFHTFEPMQMGDLFQAANELPIGAHLEMLRIEERFSRSRPDGFLIVARVHKRDAAVSRRRFFPMFKDGRAAALRPDARRL